MKNTRARFKYGLRILKQHNNQIISNSLAAKLQQTRPDHFWKEIDRLHSSEMPTPNCIDGVLVPMTLLSYGRIASSDY